MQFALVGTNVFLGAGLSSTNAPGATNGLVSPPDAGLSISGTGATETIGGFRTALGNDIGPALGGTLLTPGFSGSSGTGFGGTVIAPLGASASAPGTTNAILPGSGKTNTADALRLPVAGFTLSGTNGLFFLSTSSLEGLNNTEGIRIYSGYFETDE